MRIRIEHTDERLTRRSGMVLVDEFGRRVDLRRLVDKEFGGPGSGRGYSASAFVTAFVDMAIDGATRLEHVSFLENDEAYKALIAREHYPSADAMGDWLRRTGSSGGEGKLWKVQQPLLDLNRDRNTTLDIDASIIEADKGDGKESFKGIVGYQPLLGIIAESGLCVGSEFRYGNTSPQTGLTAFIDRCLATYPDHIRCVRSDSAGYQTDVINHLTAKKLWYTISADHNVQEMEALATIPESAWRAVAGEDYQVAETVHTLNDTPESFRLVAKRTPVMQLDLFAGNWKYWLVATNIPQDELGTAALIAFHAKRGEMERILGEMKAHFHLDHMPCGQFSANSMYFTLGILSYNIVQLMKQIALGQGAMKRSISTVRYELLHHAGRLLTHARYMILRVAAPSPYVTRLRDAYLRLHLAPLPSPA